MIEEYHFGVITIDGKNYTNDLEVRWTPKGKPAGQAGEILDWWRKESHLIDVEDVKRAIEQGPEIIVIGTGESGLVKMTDEAEKEIESKGIKLIIDVTREAIETFNIVNQESEEEEGEQVKVIGLFHLTC